VLPAEDLSKPLGRLDAVEERKHGGIRADQRARGLSRVGELPRLHRDDDDLDRPDLRGVVRRERRVHDEVPRDALDAKPVPAYGVEVRPARHETHLVSVLGEPPPEVSPDASGAYDGEAHVFKLPGFEFKKLLPDDVDP
jgi:hypothetical protein